MAAEDMEDRSPDLSLVIPAYNEEENIPTLLMRIESALAPLVAHGKTFEVVMVDDGSTDRTPQLLADGQAKYPCCA